MKNFLLLILVFLTINSGGKRIIKEKPLQIYKQYKFLVIAIFDSKFFFVTRALTKIKNLTRHCTRRKATVVLDIFKIDNFDEKQQVELAHLLKVDKIDVKCYLSDSIEEFDLEINPYP